MINEKKVYEFYNSDNFNPKLPEDIKWRHFRFKTKEGYWKKVKENVRNKEDLIKNIFLLGGIDIYYSTAKWLNPKKISTKGGGGTYHIADNLLIGSDLVFDIDAKEPITLKSLDEARKSTSNIYQLMKAHPEYEFMYFSFSGRKGFRLSYKDTIKLPPDPRHRLDFIEKNRNAFIVELLREYKSKQTLPILYKVEPFFDEKITTNVMSVIRVLGTVHSTTGYISTKLPTSYLRKPIKYILNHIPYIGKKRPGIPKREMTKEDNCELSPCSRLLLSEDDATGLTSLPYTKNHQYFITNKVLGVKKGYVPFFIYEPTQKYFKKEILKLQEKYKLGDLYIFDYEDKKVVISLKTMQKRRLQKVLNASSSKTKRDFKKHRRIFAPFLMYFNEKIDYKKPISWVSAGHLHYVEPGREYMHNRFCGWAKVELIKAMKNGW